MACSPVRTLFFFHSYLQIITHMVGFEDDRLLLLLPMLHFNMELNLFYKAIVNILHVPDETHKVVTLRTVVRFDLQLSILTF